jgi:putative Holliday junction resolvase
MLTLASNRAYCWQARDLMPTLDLQALRAAVKRGQRLLGLDLGEKTIGLALSDTELTVATPFKTLSRGKFTSDAAMLRALIAEHAVGGLVIGLPLNMDGSEGPSAQSARAFARNFAGVSDCPVAFTDERLSTAAVTRALIEADASRRRRKALVDKMAAAYILQNALDRMRHLPLRP